MKILLLGSGGREHAIAWKLKQDDSSVALVAAPGNPGITTLGRCVPVNPTDSAAVVALARNEEPDLVVIGPEAPLAAGVSDALRAAGFRVFGPSKAAAQLESSKRFAKELMLAAGVPTAGASWHTDSPSAKRAVRMGGAPVVIKASGLAAGKGVVVAQTVDEAEQAIDRIFQGAYGEAGAELLVEEFMEGEELSIFAVTDGEHFVLLPGAQDHKRLLEGDLGPNTGGMGAYAPVAVATDAVLRATCDRIVAPTLAEMRRREIPFRGLLYVGLMLTADGPKVVEFNCRFGDPETQVVLPLLDGDLARIAVACAEGRLDPGAVRWKPGFAVTVVMASAGYPGAYATGKVIEGIEEAGGEEGVVVFQAGTRREAGKTLTAGGRVLDVTGIAGDAEAARRAAYQAVSKIRFEGAHYRTDIAGG